MAKQAARWPYVLLVVVIIVAAAVSAAVIAVWAFPHHSPQAILTVEPGDNVTVNYIGMFGSGGDQGHVFDTSIYRVALNNLTYPKSLEYTPRANASAYTQLGVYVGASTPSGGFTINNWTFGSVITGFWQGMIGMTGNITRPITIPVNLGYGAADPACFASQPLVYTLPTYASIPLTTFTSAYPGITPSTGSTFTDPIYGWTNYVVSANGSWVSFQSLPALGQRTNPNGLPYYVSAISSSTITLTSTLTNAQSGKVAGTLGENQTICDTGQFIVSSVDWATGLMTLNFNPEVEGQVLIFYVTVVNIFVPA